MSHKMEHPNKFNLTIQTPSNEDKEDSELVVSDRQPKGKKRRGTHDHSLDSIQERLQVSVGLRFCVFVSMLFAVQK